MATVDALKGPVFPARTKATAVIVMLHGYGANGDDLIGLAPLLAPALPHVAFYSPNAPTPMAGGFGGYEWFSLDDYDPDALRDDAFRAKYMDMLQDRAESTSRVLHKYLDQVIAHHRITADRMALVGFSQGTMMSLHVGLRRTDKLAGIVGYSGALFSAERLIAEIVSRPPVLLAHGDADPVVPVDSLHDIEHALKAAHVPYESHVIRGLEHGIDDTCLELGLKFLREHLS